MEEAEEPGPEAALCRGHEGLDHTGQRHKGHREDDRQDAGHIDLDRDVGGLAAVHLAPDNPFRIGNRDPALRVGHKHDKRDNRDEDDNDSRDQEVVFRLFRTQLPPGPEEHKRVRPAGEDTGEQDNRDAVADPMFVDLVAHPDNQHRPGDKGGDDDDGTEYAGEAVVVVQDAVRVAQDEVIHDGHRNREAEGYKAGDRLDLFLPVVAFLRHPFQRRDRNR